MLLFLNILVGAGALSLFSCDLVAAEAAPLPQPTRTDKCEFVGGVPLGSIGTGTVEVRGDGSFREWQIFNNWGNAQTLEPSKPSLL